MKIVEKQSRIIRTLVVDDHQLARNGIRAMLQSCKKELEFDIKEASGGEKALQYLNRETVDLMIIDCRMEGMDGVETVKRVLRFRTEVKILALSNYNEYSLITAMIDAGALGYVLKSVQPDQLLTAIITVLDGKKYYCNETALVLIAAAEESDAEKKTALYKISARELEVLLLIGQGLTNAEISQQLFVTRRTVDTHRQNLLKKMKVKNTASLIRMAAELGLL